jgi:hypothetical protein
MKSCFLILILLLAALSGRAALISSNLYTLAVVNNTTNTGAVTAMGTVTLPGWTMMIQSIGTGGVNTNAGGNLLVGLSPVTNGMTVVATYNATNDTIYPVLPTNNGVITIYYCWQSFDTSPSNISIGAQAVINR